jgi:hypothetical protein
VDERVEWFKRTIADWNGGEREIEWDRIDPSFELHSAMVGGVLRGPEGLRAYFEEIDQQFGAWDVSIDRAIELGDDDFLVLGGVRLRGRGSGLEMDQELAWKLGFDGEQAVLMKTYTDVEQAHVEAGLQPPPEDAS